MSAAQPQNDTPSTSNVTTLFSYDTELCADSVEFCPLSPDHPECENAEFFACGTYQLTMHGEAISSDDHVKKGYVKLFKVQYNCNEEGNQASKNPADITVAPLNTISTKAILDMKWSHCPVNNLGMLAAVDNGGSLELLKLKDNELTLTGLSFQQEGVSFLSLDWDNRVNHSSEPRIAISKGDGGISLVKLQNQGIQEESFWVAHDFEAWITAFDYHNTNVIYSGGDDGKFKGWDTRQQPNIPIFTSKQHSMGVCSIQHHNFLSHIVATGSYDESLLIWDNRKLSKPILVSRLDGGIWRIKWHPQIHHQLLAACMHNGFQVLSMESMAESDNCWKNASLKAGYMEHQSLAYGADWSYRLHENKGVVASCSFYDHTLRLW